MRYSTWGIRRAVKRIIRKFIKMFAIFREIDLKKKRKSLDETQREQDLRLFIIGKIIYWKIFKG